MAINRKYSFKPKTNSKKKKLVKSSRKKIKTKKKVVIKKSATKKRSKKSRKNKKLKITKTRGVKMSAEAMKVSSVLDTSHLKVKFPFKAKYGNYINGKFVEPKSGKYFDNVSPISNEKICSVAVSYTHLTLPTILLV